MNIQSASRCAQLPVFTLLVGVMLAACTDRDSPTAPDPDPVTGSFELVLPATIIDGQSFQLTVTAVAQDGTKPDRAFSGAVTLSATAGSVAPAMLTLTAGVATAQVTLTGHAGTATLRAKLGSAEGSSATTVLGRGTVVRLEILPGAFLLTGAGQTRQLAVRGYDAAGNPAVAEVSWRSSNPGVLDIAADGKVTAAASNGSAQITAHVNGFSSAPVLGLIARPKGGVAPSPSSAGASGSPGSANGALLVDDDQVVGDISAVDANAAYEPGWRYQVRLRGAVPSIGQLVLGTGAAPVGGRAVAVTSAGSDVIVTLELLRLNEMFDNLVIDEQLSLIDADVEIPSDVRQEYDVRRDPDGTLHFAPIGHVGSAFGFSNAFGGAAGQDFNLGRVFKCKSPLVSLLQFRATPTLTMRPGIALDIVYDQTTGGLQKLGIVGQLTFSLKFDPKLTARLTSKADCAGQLGLITLPFGGPLAFFLGGHVPIGVGFEIEGAASFVDLGIKVSATGGVQAEMGAGCAIVCGGYLNANVNLDGDVKAEYPLDDTDDFKLEARFFAYASAGLSVGNRFLKALRFDLLEFRAGLAQFFDFSFPEVQADNPDYASSMRTSVQYLAKPGGRVEDALKLYNKQLQVGTLDLRAEIVLRETPAGTLEINPAVVRARTQNEPGEKARFTVRLPPVAGGPNYYDVAEVEIRWLKFGELIPVPGNCTGVLQQLTFVCEAEFDAVDVGQHAFYAFMTPTLFEAPITIPLELSRNSRAELTVATGPIAVTVAPGGGGGIIGLMHSDTLRFTAAITGTANTAVTWTTSNFSPRGHIDSNGVYTAPALGPGESAVDYVVATSVADPSAADIAHVKISGPPPCDPPPDEPDACGSGGGGSSSGDPHLLTPDGQYYDFMAVGDFILAKSTTAGDGFEVQSRFRPPDQADEFSWNQAVAMRVGTDVVNVYAGAAGRTELMINGEDVPVSGRLDRQLNGGGTVRVSRDSILVSWPDRTMVRIIPAHWENNVLAAVDVFLPGSRRGKVEGLLGNFDGKRANDIRIRGGAVLSDVRSPELYLSFRQSWRVASGSTGSLFFRNFENWDPFFPPDIVGLDDLDRTAVARAETVCRAAGVINLRVLQGCMFDVALTGDDEWALIAAGRDPSRPSVTVVPGLAFVERGAARDFSAIVTGTSSRQVAWSATGGTIAPQSATGVTYTAPSQNGAYALTARLAAQPQVSDDATVHVTGIAVPEGYTAVWTGAMSTAWLDGRNWVAGSPPLPTDNVFIPAAAPRHPVVTDHDTIFNLLVEAGANVTISPGTDGNRCDDNPPFDCLFVAGNLDAAGTIAGTRSVVMIGSGREVKGTIDNLVIRGSISAAGPLTVTTLAIDARATTGLFRINGQTVTVHGNFTAYSQTSGGLSMTNPADHLIIRGNALFQAADRRGALTAGEIHVAGNFEARQHNNDNSIGGFPATGTKVVLNGTAEQRVTFITRQLNGANASHFHDLEITNPTVIRFEPTHLNRNGAQVTGRLTVSAAASLTGAALTVSGDLTTVPGSRITPGLIRLAGALGTTGVQGVFEPATVQFIGTTQQPMKPDLAYRNVEITAPVRLVGPTSVAGYVKIYSDNGLQGPLVFNSQTLTVEGDFLTASGDAPTMVDPADRLIVKGSMDLQGGDSRGKLTAGEVYVARDFAAGPFNFASTGTKVILNGTAVQKVQITTSFTGDTRSFFHDLDIINPAGVEFLPVPSNGLVVVNRHLDLKGAMTVVAGARMQVLNTLFLRATATLTNNGTLTVTTCVKEDGYTIQGTGASPCL